MVGSKKDRLHVLVGFNSNSIGSGDVAIGMRIRAAARARHAHYESQESFIFWFMADMASISVPIDSSGYDFETLLLCYEKYIAGWRSPPRVPSGRVAT